MAQYISAPHSFMSRPQKKIWCNGIEVTPMTCTGAAWLAQPDADPWGLSTTSVGLGTGGCWDGRDIDTVASIARWTESTA